MKMLASPWVLALLGGVMSIVTTVALLVPAVSGIAPPARVHAVGAAAPRWRRGESLPRKAWRAGPLSLMLR